MLGLQEYILGRTRMISGALLIQSQGHVRHKALVMCRSSKPARAQSCLPQMWLREVLVCHTHLLPSLNERHLQSLPVSDAFHSS